MTSIAMERVLDALYSKETAENGFDQEAADSNFMKSLCEIYGLKHSAYITVDKRSFSSRKPKFLVTYPVSWQEEYKKSFAERKDPVLLAGLSEMLPFDWRRLTPIVPESDKMLGVAREFGIGKQGLSIPIRGASGARALFSVTGDYNDRDWHDMRRQYLRDFVILANFFHKRISGSIAEGAPQLSEREKDILQYCALGMTAGQISENLQITVSTVKYFLNQIRYKMNVLNTTHAVAKAIKFGMITIL
jgi:DNA-binding CsgD family transcriptional regulator